MKRFYIISSCIFCLTIQCISQPFTLDQTFGYGGKIYTNINDINKSNESANVVAMQADGKIIIAGTTIGPAAIVRYNADGSSDNTFGKEGMVFCYVFTINAVAVQPDGKILIAGTSNNDFAMARFNANGSVDNSFGNNGRVSTAIGTGTDVAACMLLQADGKILLGGYTSNGVDNDFALARYNSNGTPDNGFNSTGKVSFAVGASNDMINCMSIQTDGKIIAAGSSSNATSTEFAVSRLNADGTLDNSFDTDGKVNTDMTGENDYIKTILIQADGKIIASGITGNDINAQNIGICHYNTDGSTDNSFDGDGKMIVTNSYIRRIYSVQIQSDGKVIFAGYDDNYDFGIVRLAADGNADNSFDGDGKQTTAVGPNIDQINAVGIQPDGKIIAVGKAEGVGGVWTDFALARFNSDGSLDNEFNGNGKVITIIYSSDDHATCTAVQSDGKVIVGGCSYTNITNSTINRRKFALARYNTNGTLDNTFGNNGRVLTDFGGSENEIAAIAIQPDGKIVAVGENLATDYDFAIARYNTDGSPDNSFNGNGKQSVSFAPRQDGALAVVIQPDGKIVVGGSTRDATTSNHDFALLRLNTDGSLDNSFDGDGKVYLSIGPGVDAITAIALQTDGKILAAGYSHNGNDYDFAVVRFNTDGAPDITFDGDGIVTTDMGGNNNSASSMRIQPDGKILLAGNRQIGTTNDFAMARYNTNGSLDNTFNGNGTVITDVTPGNDVLSSIALQNNGRIVAAGYSDNGSNYDFSMMRYNSNGTPDNSVNGNGKAIFDLEGGSSERGFGVALTLNRIYMAGDITTAGRSDFALVAILNDVLTSPLPLQLISFTGNRANTDALLNWKTENESAMLEYIVERSVDGRSYTAIGSVTAENKTGVHTYSLTDNNITSLNASVVYYRLRQKGIDGKITYSRIIALPLDKNRNIVLIYPNPVVEQINIALTVSRRDNLQIRIFDNTGRTVKQQQWNVSAGSASMSVDVKSLSAGMYYLEIKGEETEYKKQFVK